MQLVSVFMSITSSIQTFKQWYSITNNCDPLDSSWVWDTVHARGRMCITHVDDTPDSEHTIRRI